MAQVKVATKKVLRDGSNAPEGVGITFTDGSTVEVLFTQLTEEILAELTALGLGSKLGDSYAGAGGDVKLAHAQARVVADTLLAGSWTSRGTGMASATVEGIARALGLSVEEAQEKFDGLDEAKQKAVLAHPQVKAAIAQIKAERAGKKATAAPDLGALLG